MTVFNGEEAIVTFLEEFDSWLSEPVDVALLKSYSSDMFSPETADR